MTMGTHQQAAADDGTAQIDPDTTRVKVMVAGKICVPPQGLTTDFTYSSSVPLTCKAFYILHHI